MKKILLLSLILFLCFGIGLSYAAKSSQFPASDNILVDNGSGGATGLTPPTKIIKVRYGGQGTSLAKLLSGESVIWDSTSADGYTVARCDTAGDERFAGILVTDIQTADVGDTNTASQYNTGWMAIKGYAIASIDGSITLGATTARLGPGASGSLMDRGEAANSTDVATLLKTSVSGASNRSPVWLRD